MRDRGAEAIVYMGYGYSTFHFKKGFDALELGPAALHGHRVHVLLEHQRVGARASKAGTASTSSARTARTRTTKASSSGIQRRFGRSVGNVVVALAYDTARAAIHGIANATIAIPSEVKLGLEKIKWMPCTNGGPGHLRHVRAARPPRLQGRLPHDPPPAQRQVRVRELPPPAMAVEHGVAAARRLIEGSASGVSLGADPTTRSRAW